MSEEPTESAAVELRGPCRTPDGSRAYSEDILRDFIALDGQPSSGGVATRADDATVRVIVGLPTDVGRPW